MSQDFTDNVFATDHAVQTDMQNIENNFAALKSAFSGTTTPADAVAGMWWFDTTANILKIRNEANNAWQSVWDFANSKPIISNLSDEITGAMIAAAIKDPAAGTYGLRRLGTGAAQACAGNDSRLSDTRTPTGASVTQAKLKTSTGSLSGTLAGGMTYITMSAYNFSPNIFVQAPASNVGSVIASNVNSADQIARFALYNGGGDRDYAVRWRYVTSSGEIHWIFILRDKITKKTVQLWQTPDHPCFGSCKPLLIPHPFGDYDETKYEIIVINPTNEEIEQMELETIVDDETKPDKDLLEVITENYEIDEDSSPAWPTKPVTVGLPKHIVDKKTGKKILADYRFMGKDDVITPIRKIIPKPSYIKTKRLKRK